MISHGKSHLSGCRSLRLVNAIPARAWLRKSDAETPRQQPEPLVGDETGGRQRVGVGKEGAWRDRVATWEQRRRRHDREAGSLVFPGCPRDIDSMHDQDDFSNAGRKQY